MFCVCVIVLLDGCLVFMIDDVFVVVKFVLWYWMVLKYLVCVEGVMVDDVIECFS